MEFLVPLMPLFGTLPFALSAAWIVHRILRHRERMARNSTQIEDVQQQLDALRDAHFELQERLDVAERVLAQVRDAQPPRALE